MIKFNKLYDERKVRVYSVSGTSLLPDYHYEYDEKGVCSLVPSGTFLDFQLQINNDAETCSIEHIIERFVNGDDNAFNVNPGAYFDATDMPTTISEIYQRVNDCNDYFAKLNPKIKEKFNNSPSEFWTKYGTDEFDTIISSMFDSNNVDISTDNLTNKDIVSGGDIDE